MAEILIVEDEISINELIRKNLSLTGHYCTQVFDGLSAVTLLENGSFDLVVPDIMLPGLDGYQVFERTVGTPTIFLTGAVVILMMSFFLFHFLNIIFLPLRQISSVAHHFNLMAERIEIQIKQLEDAAEQKQQLLNMALLSRDEIKNEDCSVKELFMQSERSMYKRAEECKLIDGSVDRVEYNCQGYSGNDPTITVDIISKNGECWGQHNNMDNESGKVVKAKSVCWKNQ